MYNQPYFYLLSGSNLTVPSNTVTEFICSAFAVLDYSEQFNAQQEGVAVRDAFWQNAWQLLLVLC